MDTLDPQLKQAKPLHAESGSEPTNIFLCVAQFIYGCANSSYNSFLSIWLASRGFTYSQIGYVRGLSHLSFLVLVPLFCLVVDVSSKKNQITRQFLLAVSCMIAALSKLLFIFWQNSWDIWFCVLVMVTIAIQETTSKVTDSIIFSKIVDPNTYGRYPLWQGVGFGISSFGLGFLFEYVLG